MAYQENEATHVGVEAVVTAGDITADNDNPSQALLLESKISQNLALASVSSCYDRHHQRHLQCQCLAVMRNREDLCEAIGEYQLMFSNLAFVDQKKIVIEWMRATPFEGGKNLPYSIHP
jgi:hypothetical protein